MDGRRKSRKTTRHRWVGAFVLPLSDATAKKAAAYLSQSENGRVPGTKPIEIVPTMLDVYCEQCRLSYRQAEPVCHGIVVAHLVKRKTA